jgi:WD40 repeat protein
VVQRLRYTSPASLAATLYRDGMTPVQAPKGPPLLERLWNLASGDDTRAGVTLENPQCLTFAPDHRTLAIGDDNGFIHLVDVVTGKELQRLHAGGSTVSRLIFLEVGKLLCSQQRSGAIQFWDVPTGKLRPLRLADATDATMSPLAASSGGKLAAETHDGSVLIWNRYDDPRPRHVPCPRGAELLQFTRDGKKLLARAPTGNTGRIQLIDVAAGKVVGTIGDQSVATFGVAPDGSLVASWDRTTTTTPEVWDKTVRLRDLTGAPRGELAVTPSAYNGLPFTPDSRYLFVEQAGGLGLWEIAPRQQRMLVPGSWPLAVSGDSRFVVSTGRGCLFVWGLTGMSKSEIRNPK